MKRLHVVAPLLMLMLLCSPSLGALTDWSSGQVKHIVDPDDGFLPGQEILAAWHKYDAGSGMHFFKMELKDVPMGPAGSSPGFAGIYGFAINVNPETGIDGWTPGLNYAPNVGAIDYLLDAHFDFAGIGTFPPTFQKADYHEWEWPMFLTENLFTVGGAYEQDGKFMEWAVPDVMIGSPGEFIYGWCAYTLDGGSETAKYDVACSIIPEPLTLAGLGMGIAGLAGYLRRRKKA